MLKIRLQRTGIKNKPKYRVVVSEEHTKRDGSVVETIGIYDPNMDPPSIELKKDRFQHWRALGAQSTNAVRNLVKRYERIN